MTSCILCGESVEIRHYDDKIIPFHKTGRCTERILKQYFLKNEYCYPTRCKNCNAQVFFVRHNGGSVYFDALGFPWPKHPCYADDDIDNKLINAIINQDMEHASSYSVGTVLEAKQFQKRTWQILVECPEGDIALIKLPEFVGIAKFKGELIGISETYKLIYYINPFEEKEIFETKLPKHVRRILEIEWKRREQSTGSEIGIQPIPIELPKREFYVSNRVYRDSKISMEVKQIYQSRCQICNKYIELQDGRRYSECHHIKPLGEPHNGPDVIGNLICVCPNCHVQLDYGVIAIDKDKINIDVDHIIDDEYVAYHNTKIFNRAQNN